MRFSLGRYHDEVIAALVGALLGLGAPAGWLFFRAVTAQPGWLKQEFQHSTDIYRYMTVGTVLVFSVFGFVVGRRGDGAMNKAETLKKELFHVNEMAFTDPLTGLFNARHLHKELTLQIELARRYEVPVSCAIFDIDGFKQINDSLGHPFGDHVLATLGKVIGGCVRKVDVAGRLGGEEFLIIMPHTLPEHAAAIAERVRLSVEQAQFSIGAQATQVTVSGGVASFPSAGIADKSSLLKTADAALYRAKYTGKNRIVMASIVHKDEVSHA